MQLDQMTPLEIARVMNEEDHKVADAVGEVLLQVAQAITWAKEALEAGGRVIYFGAGTSGRLGVLDAVECPPTFGVDPGVVVGLIAGGEKAFVRAIEGAEDSQTLCVEELKDIGLCEKDLAVGLAASGRTPYVIGGLAYANALGCKTIAVTANKGSEAGAVAQLAIEAEPGPEVLTGSTRLKAGTAEKLILNMISTGAMVGIGKVYQNLMVDVQQTNEKLVSRARNIVCEATGCSLQDADKTLRLADEDVKCAVVMLLAQVNADEARSRLQAARGHVREAIADT
jgi:N-acetylmuramic acid 6-phosphate etherase